VAAGGTISFTVANGPGNARDWVTWHGFALNVTPDLYIDPATGRALAIERFQQVWEP